MNYPKIDDQIYKEVESFEDYEYTNCIAYEMAIRNGKVKQLLEKIDNLPMYHDKYEESYCPIEYDEIDEELEKYYFIDYKIRKHLKFTYESYLKEYHEIFFKRAKYVKVMQIIEKKVFGKDIIEELTNYEEKVSNYFYKNLEKISFVYDKYTTEENKTHSNSRRLMKKIYGIRGDGQFIEEDEEKKAIIENRAFLVFKRPRLLIPQDLDKTIALTINLNLPQEELKAYIEHIKREYDKSNSIIKNPLEQLGKKLDKAKKVKSKALPKGKNKRKKAMANAFYVYDMYKILEQEYSIKTNNLKAERDTQIKNIKLSKNYDRQEKESMIQDIKEEYNYLLEQYSKTSIKTEINLQSGLSIDDIERYKTLMNKYIDKLKYKELITGITN